MFITFEQFFCLFQHFIKLFITNFVRLDPDPQKMNADPQPCFKVRNEFSPLGCVRSIVWSRSQWSRNYFVESEPVEKELLVFV